MLNKSIKDNMPPVFAAAFDTLQNLHLVSGCGWHERTLGKIDRLLSNLWIPHFTDDGGNLVLNCGSSEELTTSLKRGRINQILQAHLDHPGAIVIKKLNENQNFYSAQWFGGYSNSLEGRELFFYDHASEKSGLVKVESEEHLGAGRFIFFRSDEELQTKLTTLHCKSNGGGNNGSLHSWAIDDLAGCAAIINTFNNISDTGTIGLLTLGEEIGAYGLWHFVNKYLKDDAAVLPYIINIDIPEEEENDFRFGSGVWLRSADRRCNYSEKLINFMDEKFPALKKISLKRGGTEASTLVGMGYDAVSMAIPARNLHNGSRHSCLTEESVSFEDINALCKFASSLLPARKMENAGSSQNKNGSHKKLPEIKCSNYAGDVCEKLLNSNEYCDYLLNCASHWSKAHINYGIPVVHLTSFQYDDLKKRLESGMPLVSQKSVENTARKLLPSILQKVGGRNSLGIETLNILLFLMANFNACNIKDDIALSVDKIDEDADLSRLLAHEITHWICNRLYDFSAHNNYVQMLIQEGSACFISGEICRIGPAKALGIPDKTYEHYKDIQKDLKTAFRKIIEGDVINFEKTPKHETLNLTPYVDPYRISKGNPLNKYGYFLGLEFVEFCLKCGNSIEAFLSDFRLRRECLDVFLS